MRKVFAVILGMVCLWIFEACSPKVGNSSSQRDNNEQSSNNSNTKLDEQESNGNLKKNKNGLQTHPELQVQKVKSVPKKSHQNVKKGE